MSEYSKSMLEAGLWNKTGKAILEPLTKKSLKQFINNLSDKKAELYSLEEDSEEVKIEPYLEGSFSTYYKSGYPPAVKKYRLMFESFTASIEENYFWVVSQLRRDQGYRDIHKITDTFSASEQSAFWGAAQTRMKIQQDNVSQYLIAIGKLVRELFQIVRELRIIDERLVMYDEWKISKSADVSLKGLYVDMVEGASKNPSSVYGLAQQVGFTILPDLFFNTHVHSTAEVDSVVDATKYNKAIKNVLKRKLYSYVTWKIKTDKELRDRKKFQLKYLRQHWAVIKMYMDWLKPYLRNIRRMQMSEKHVESVDIISAFETSMTEIEIMAVKPEMKGYRPVIISTFHYRTRPDMTFQQDNYAHRGPIHVGRVLMEFRAYSWTDKDIDKYKNYRRAESMKLFSVIDESVKAAVESLGDTLENYLKEAGESIDSDEKETPKKKKNNYGMLEPFLAVFKGFGELFGAIIPMPNFKSDGPKVKKESASYKLGAKSAKKKASEIAKTNAWLIYKNFKKAHKMITW
ncbi:MAG: hypothetical protein ABIB43_03920 [archaeon]